MRTAIVVGLSLLIASCGDDIVAEPLVDTSVVGSFDGVEFVPINGYATVYRERAIIVLGTGPVGCGSEASDLPPRGHTATMAIPALTEGSYSNVEVQLYSNVDRFQSANASVGTVTISSVTDASVVGEISFVYTDTQEHEFSVVGTFEVAHCAY